MLILSSSFDKKGRVPSFGKKNGRRVTFPYLRHTRYALRGFQQPRKTKRIDALQQDGHPQMLAAVPALYALEMELFRRAYRLIAYAMDGKHSLTPF